MQQSALLVRIRPGQRAELEKVFELFSGSLKGNFEEMLTESNVHSHSVWLVEGPDYDSVFVVVEAEDPSVALERLFTPDYAFLEWLRGKAIRTTTVDADYELLKPLFRWTSDEADGV